MKIFIICPVRGCTDEEREQIANYVSLLEDILSIEVYWPMRDTPQVDETSGLEILAANEQSLLAADEVHVWYNPKSQGTHFDLGIAYTARKRLMLINDFDVPCANSFEAILETWPWGRNLEEGQ